MNKKFGIRHIIREAVGSLSREIRICFTPVVQPEKWVFVVGCANSGTTLLSKILEQSDDIEALPVEGQFLTDQFVVDMDIGLPRMWTRNQYVFRLSESDTSVDPDRLKKEWSMRLSRKKPIVLEHSPPNVARLLWLQKNFKNAYFVNIVRNGYAVAEGIKRKASPAYIPGGYPIEWCAKHWVESNQRFIEDSPQLERCITLHYEELTSNLSGTMEAVYRFLDVNHAPIPKEGQALSVHERNEPVTDLNDVSISALSIEEIAKINYISKGMLKTYGYEVLEND